ncbi:O-antigen ligase family protein [Endozoicomonas sp. ALD040]|uniref:O-antigen ligase family protein n=1 Tax=Endozoicomonas sp. ALD040 TaxID=3403079 RepID=UPI003BB18C68
MLKFYIFLFMNISLQDKTNHIILKWIIPFGMIVFLTGQIILPNNSSHISQTYTWLILPAFILLFTSGKEVFKEHRVNTLAILTLCFIVLYTLSFLWSDTDEDAGRFIKDGIYIVLFIFSIYMLIRSDYWDFSRILETSALIISIGAAISLLNHFFILDAPIGVREYRISNMGDWGFGNLDNPIPAAIYYGSFSAILFVLFSDRKSSKARSFLKLISLLVLNTYVMFTWSRGPIISLFLSYFLSWILIKNKKSTIALLAITISSSLIYFSDQISTGISDTLNNRQSTYTTNEIELVSSGIIATGSKFKFMESLEESEDFLNKTFSERGSIWLTTYKRSLERFWFGHGAGAKFQIPYNQNRTIAFHAHNIYLQVFYELGFIGLFLFAFLLCLLIKNLYTTRENINTKIAIALLCIGLFSYITDVSKIFTKPHIYWINFWLPLGIGIAIKMKISASPLTFSRNQ